MNGLQRAAAGALAGLLATVPMSAAMGSMKQLLPRRERYPLPPHLVTMEVAERAGVRDELPRRGPARATATAVSHLGYGAAAGALYGAVRHRLPGPALGRGIAFGLAVWSGSYLGWLPLAGLFNPATKQPARRNALMIAAHVVWGAGLGLLADWLSTERWEG